MDTSSVLRTSVITTTTPPPGPVSPIRHTNDETTHFTGTNGAVVVVAMGGTVDAAVVDVVVEVVEELGSDAFIYGKPVDKSIKFAQETDEGAQVIVRWDPKNPPKIGDTISVKAIASAVHLFDANSGLRIN